MDSQKSGSAAASDTELTTLVQGAATEQVARLDTCTSSDASDAKPPDAIVIRSQGCQMPAAAHCPLRVLRASPPMHSLEQVVGPACCPVGQP
ncbi:hypothetical protein HaLaN_11626 [Haematococcus lacustris]|uniref:Uncharacterized protein n=1 Tax=Haematococcus lacustris TaxID=44745 RepID=A0A699YYN6_HAELA|nr:hypothetical protein HaLaN_11626 [Haematococcus lacustris]